jgi:hypothetical protein
MLGVALGTGTKQGGKKQQGGNFSRTGALEKEICVQLALSASRQGHLLSLMNKQGTVMSSNRDNVSCCVERKLYREGEV